MYNKFFIFLSSLVFVLAVEISKCINIIILNKESITPLLLEIVQNYPILPSVQEIKVIDYGKNKRRGQGKRVGKMVIGAMSCAMYFKEGKHTELVTNIYGNLKDYDSVKEDLSLFNYDLPFKKFIYLKARNLGINHENSFRIALVWGE